MHNFSNLRPAAASMMKVNMNLKDGEKVAFVTDIAVPAYWQRFSTTELADITTRSLMAKSLCEMMAEEFPACRFDFLCFPMTPQSGSEPPDDMAWKFKEYDVLILMTSNSLSHTRAREEACKAGAPE